MFLEDYDPEEDDDAAAVKDQKFDVLFRTATNHRREVKSNVTQTATPKSFVGRQHKHWHWLR